MACLHVWLHMWPPRQSVGSCREGDQGVSLWQLPHLCLMEVGGKMGLLQRWLLSPRKKQLKPPEGHPKGPLAASQQALARQVQPRHMFLSLRPVACLCPDRQWGAGAPGARSLGGREGWEPRSS